MPEKTAGEMTSGPKPVEVARESLAGVRSPAVALVVRGERPGLLDRLAKAVPDAVITVLDVDAGMDAVHLALTAGRPWDLVLDVAAGKGTAKRWPVLLHHVRRGGNLAVRVPDSSRPLEGSVVDVAAARRAGAEPPTPGRDLRDNPERDLAALAASTTDLRVRDGWLRATSAVDTLAKVPEADGDAFLRARPSAGRTLTTVPGLRFESRCALRSSAPVDLPSEYDAPAVSLREYGDVTCLGRQAAYGDGFVLPESYRHPFKRRLRNVAFAEWAHRFVRRPEPATAALDGPAYLLDTYVRGHFGHALTDQLGHLWGWRTALDRYPDLRALVFARSPGRTSRAGSGSCSPPAASTPTRLVVAHEPTVVEVLVASSPMFGMPAYVHPAIATTYAEVGAGLAARSTAQQPGRVRCGCSAPGGPASEAATTPRTSRVCSWLMASRWCTRRTTRCRSRPGWCGTPTWSLASPGAGCSRSPSPAGRST